MDGATDVGGEAGETEGRAEAGCVEEDVVEGEAGEGGVVRVVAEEEFVVG